MTGNMLRRKSLSLEKAPIEKPPPSRRERRSSVATGSLATIDARERRGSIVQRWFKHISDAADAFNKNRNGGRSSRPDASLPGQSSPPDGDTSEDSLDKTKEHDDSGDLGKSDELNTSGTSQESTDSSTQSQTLGTSGDATDCQKKSAESSPSHRRVVDPLRLTTVENQLIQPSEIVISQKSVLTAEPVLTPLEQLRVQDTLIRRSLEEKQHLVADILHVPREEFMTIAELAGEPGGEKDPSELVMAAIYQANHLTEALNETLSVTEEDAVSASAEFPSCSPRGRRRGRLPGLPVPRVQGISSALNSHLSHLLETVREREEERERLRKELQRSREQIHALHEAHRKLTCSACAQAKAMDEPGAQSEDAPQDEASSPKPNDNEPNDDVEIEGVDAITSDSANEESNADTGLEVFVDAISNGEETTDSNPETDKPSDFVQTEQAEGGD